MQSKLLASTFKLPQQKQPIDSYQSLQSRIHDVCFQVNIQSKINIEQIERVCKGNVRLHAVAHMLRFHAPPAGLKDGAYAILLSSIVNMFTLMMTSSKMIQFFNKLSIPFSVFRIIARLYATNRSQIQFFKKIEVQHCFKFMWKMLNVRKQKFPRLYAFLVLNILNEYRQQSIQLAKRYQSDGLIVNKQSQRVQQTIKTIINIGLDLIKNNLKLSAETGVLVAMYRRATRNNLDMPVTIQLIQTIGQHMKAQQSREIILSHLDLCRVFALFTNVDLRMQEGEIVEKVQKCSAIIQQLLSQSSTLFYFIHEKITLKNFVISLKSKNKSQKQRSIINEKIFKKLVDKALRYDRNKMQRSNNTFGLCSNYLNYRALLILSFFLISTDLFEIYMSTDPNGTLFAGLGKISLMYFPITFEKGKFNKQIIQTIKISSASDLEKLNKDFLSILSYYDYCIIPYQFSRSEVINYLLYIKNLDCYKEQITNQNKQALESLLKRAKDNEQNFQTLLLDFYTEVMKIFEVLPWKPEYLKLAKFLSVIVDFLRSHNYDAIMNSCLDFVNKIFLQPKLNFYRYMYITVLDDAGKYFQFQQAIQGLILTYYKNSQYAFRISRILLHIDLNKNQVQSLGTISPKKMLEKICCDGGSEELVLQIIQIIKFYCIEFDDKAEDGVKIICEKLIYSHSEEIACAAVQFCEQFVINHRAHKNQLYKINLPQIKENNLRKRIMYLMLNSQKGIEILNNFNPTFIKDEIQLWLKQGHNHTKQFSAFLSKQNKKFTANKDATFLDIGKVSQNRHRLIYIPWNVQINQKRFAALANYKLLEERIKLRVNPELLLVEPKIEIVTFDIGGFNFSSNTLSIKREEVIKHYEKNRRKIFAIYKQNITLFFKYETGCLVLIKIIIDIPLARDVYRSISYPLSFISLMTKTGKGLNYLRENRFAQECIKFCKFREDKQEKDIDIQLSKGAIQCLGLLFSCWKLENLEKIQIFAVILEVFQKTSNFQLKQVTLWVLNIIVKDEDLRQKLKSNKGWLIMQSKYCGWLCYPQFYNQSQFSNKSLNQFAHIHEMLEKNRQGCPLTSVYLYMTKKAQNLLQNMDPLSKQEDPQIIRRKMLQFFRKQENKQLTFNAKLLDKVVTYISIVNYGVRWTWEMIDLFTNYYLSEKFDSDVNFGSSMP